MSDDARDFHKPVRRPAVVFDRAFASEDPAEAVRAAHSTAHALLARVRLGADPDAVERLIAFTDEHGIDDIAELWSRAPARSLPGALWRLYLIQRMIHDDSRTAALLYERGRMELHSPDDLVAGAPSPAGPDELVALIDTILRGAFTGDVAVALDRAGSFCRVQASGAVHLAADYEHTEPERASMLTARAARLTDFATDLTACGGLWRRDSLT